MVLLVGTCYNGTPNSSSLVQCFNFKTFFFFFFLKEGRMHDARMLAVSDLYDDLENFAFCPVGREMCLYGVHLQAELGF